MLPTLNIGPLSLNFPPLVLLLAFWAGSWLACSPRAPWPRREGEGFIHLAWLENALYLGLAAGLAGARLGYAARFLEIYGRSPLSLLALDLNTLDPGSGMLVGGLAGLIYLRRKGQALGPALDRLAPFFAALAAGVGLAQFAAGDAYGVPTNLPWAVYLWDAWRHPVQIYEAGAALLALIVIFLIPMRLKYPGGNPGGVEGRLFLGTAALLAGARLLLEPLRFESATWTGGIREAQVIALAVLLAALWGLGRNQSGYFFSKFGRESKG